MRRTAVLLILAACVSVPAWAQGRKTRSRAYAPLSVTPLREGAKLRYITKLLGPTEEQKEQIEALIEMFEVELADMRADLRGKIQRLIPPLADELRKAMDEGDTARAEEIRLEMLSYTQPEGHLEKKFLEEDLPQVFTPEQLKALPKIQERLKKNPSGELRPIDIVRVVRALDLTEKQAMRLRNVQRIARVSTSAQVSLQGDTKMQLLKRMIQEIKAFLTPEQADTFTKRIERLSAKPLDEIMSFKNPNAGAGRPKKGERQRKAARKLMGPGRGGKKDKSRKEKSGQKP